MNFAFSFIIGRQLAISQGASTQQATTDGLVSAMLKQPMGLVLALTLARNQQAAPPAGAAGTAPGNVQSGNVQPGNVQPGLGPITTASNLSLSLNFPAHVNPKQPIKGTVAFTNNGTGAAKVQRFLVAVSGARSHGPTVHAVPAGIHHAIDTSAGIITFSGLPSEIPPGTTIGPFSVSFTPTAESSAAMVVADVDTASGHVIETVKTTINSAS